MNARILFLSLLAGTAAWSLAGCAEIKQDTDELGEYQSGEIPSGSVFSPPAPDPAPPIHTPPEADYNPYSPPTPSY